MIDRYSLEPMKSLWTKRDSRCRVMLRVELAILHAKADLGIIPRRAYKIIEENANFDMDRVIALEKLHDHDVNGFVFAVHEWLTQRGYGEHARYFHDGNTSYDIVDPALVLMLREAVKQIIKKLEQLRQTLLVQAYKHQWSYMIGRTHGEPGEPTTFGHFLLVQVLEIDECTRRFKSLLRHELKEARMSGALGVYGNVGPLVEKKALAYLGLRPAKVSTQILARSRHARVISEVAATGMVIANICQTFWDMMHMFCRELKEPSRAEKKRGSSAMPHKKWNKIYIERLTGLPRVLVGYETAALMDILTHEWRAIEQSSVERIIFPDATILLDYEISTMTWLVENLIVYPKRMRKHLDALGGLWATQGVMKALISKGVSRDTAYDYLSDISDQVLDHGIPMRPLLKAVVPGQGGRSAFNLIGASQLRQLFDYKKYVERGVMHMFSQFEEPEV